MKNALFWHFAKRMLRRRALAVGTIVFAVISAGGLAAGLVVSTAQDGGHQLHRVEAHHAMPKANRRRLVAARELGAVCLEKTY